MNRFISGHYGQFPLMILSYDSFRIFSNALGMISNLDLLICDEGHRLKNPEANITSRELFNSTAMYRLVMSGTIVQNNLLELYSLINFIIPGEFLCYFLIFFSFF